jgi:hypothetical protein
VGISDFSCVEVIRYMDQVNPLKIEKTARHPRNNLDWTKLGIFDQCGKTVQTGLEQKKFSNLCGETL